MTIQTIKKLQKQYGYDKWQEFIESGQVWRFEGTAGRIADNLLEAGVCFLPEIRVPDYWGNTVPRRKDLKAGTKGTLENAERFWQDIEAGAVTLEQDQYFDWL